MKQCPVFKNKFMGLTCVLLQTFYYLLFIYLKGGEV